MLTVNDVNANIVSSPTFNEPWYMYVTSERERERLLNSTNITRILNFENIIVHVFDVRQQYCAILCDDCVFSDVDINKRLIR